MLGYFNFLEVQMVEGGIAEKFPDEWDLQFLGNTIKPPSLWNST